MNTIKQKKPINKYKFDRVSKKKGNVVCKTYLCRTAENYCQCLGEIAFQAVKQGDFLYVRLLDGTYWRYYVGEGSYHYDWIAFYEMYEVW